MLGSSTSSGHEISNRRRTKGIQQESSLLEESRVQTAPDTSPNSCRSAGFIVKTYAQYNIQERVSLR